MMVKTPQQAGSEFEEEFRLYLKDLMQRSQCAGLRLYDTKAAGAYLPDQPGDFIMCKQGQTHLWELKSSAAVSSLASQLSLLSKEQATHLRLWSRAGATTHVLFLDQQGKTIELWNGLYAGEIRHRPRARLDKTACLRYSNFLEFQEVFRENLQRDRRFGAPYPTMSQQ